ncbi:hypothetical protein [Nostoc sp.]|uniref:hypothetical protein n=1 Tax=Nostoc sp. TaxID=1180 RepID=UPI002FEEFE80
MSIPGFHFAKLLLTCYVIVSTGGVAIAQSTETIDINGTWKGIATAGNVSLPFKWLIKQQGNHVVIEATGSNPDGTLYPAWNYKWRPLNL